MAHRRNAEIQNAADRAHQIDDGVRTRAQGLWRHVGHEGDGGSAVRSQDRKSTRLNSSHWNKSRMPSSA